MKVAIIGASGKTGTQLVSQALDRGHQVSALCRERSAGRLAAFEARTGFELFTAGVVSDEVSLSQALVGCDAAVAILISIRQLKATALVAALATTTGVHGPRRLAFTAGEVTAVPEDGEVLTPRQRLMLHLVPPLLWFTPVSMGDMLKASEMVRKQTDWEWTIVRAPTLRDGPAVGYRLCEIGELTSSDTLSREDFAACLLDSLSGTDRARRTLTAVTSGA
jgi:putative NADH-flavin reductase